MIYSWQQEAANTDGSYHSFMLDCCFFYLCVFILHFLLDFQDSNMSPALSLLPGVDHNLTEFSLLQQSETEFAPLR